MITAIKIAKQLTDLIETGLDKLQQEDELDRLVKMARRETAYRDWAALNATCLNALPEVLQPYMRPFERQDEPPELPAKLSVCVEIPDLAPIYVLLVSSGPGPEYTMVCDMFGWPYSIWGCSRVFLSTELDLALAVAKRCYEKWLQKGKPEEAFVEPIKKPVVVEYLPLAPIA